MKTNRVLLLVGALTTLGGGLWATLGNGPRITSLSAVPVSGTEPDVRHDARNFSALRSEFDLLRTELHAIKTLDRDADSLERELRSLKQEVAALGQQVAMIADESQRGDALPQTPAEMALFEEDRAYEEEEQERQLGAHFAAQSVDTVWSLDTAQLVSEAALSEGLAGSSIDGIECRSSLCRVEVSHADPAAASEFALWFPVVLGEALPQIRYFHEQRDYGPPVTVLYMARQGYDLPAERP